MSRLTNSPHWTPRSISISAESQSRATTRYVSLSKKRRLIALRPTRSNCRACRDYRQIFPHLSKIASTGAYRPKYWRPFRASSTLQNLNHIIDVVSTKVPEIEIPDGVEPKPSPPTVSETVYLIELNDYDADHRSRFRPRPHPRPHPIPLTRPNRQRTSRRLSR